MDLTFVDMTFVDMDRLPLILLAVVAAGGAAYALIYPMLSGEKRVEQRQKMIGSVSLDRRRAATQAASESLRRGQVADSLKALDDRQKRIDRPTLAMRIAQAGLKWSNQKFYMASAILGLGLAAAALTFSGDMRLALALAFVGALGAPRWILGFLKKRRMAKFLTELPNAVEIILRGLKAGLPLGDCVRIVAAESQEPVRSEFRLIVEEQTIGIPLAEAVSKLYERMPVPEANFLGIVITIQAKAGGSLSDALGNLARVLRDRKKMKAKIEAMSMEAKASAAIIGSLPIITIAIISVTSPTYMQLMWTTDLGRVMLAGSAVLMLTGVLVMKKMISFDF